jgi:muramoyltetrapeptide carboxypeptidase
MLRVAVCAPSTPFDRDYPGLDLVFHEQCFAQEGHFAGPDALRLAAFVDCANDPSCDAVWFARGGYGAARIAQDAMGLLGPAAAGKAYLGYSDGGVLLAALYRAGLVAPSTRRCRWTCGARAARPVRRVLDWLSGDSVGLEPHAAGQCRSWRSI